MTSTLSQSTPSNHVSSSSDAHALERNEPMVTAENNKITDIEEETPLTSAASSTLASPAPASPTTSHPEEDGDVETEESAMITNKNEKAVNSDATASTTTVKKPLVDESHSMLSSYIKRSLSGLFSDIARAVDQTAPTTDENEDEDPEQQYPAEQSAGEEFQVMPISGGETNAGYHHSDGSTTVTDHEYTTPIMVECDDDIIITPPVRKRSRLDLEMADAAEEPVELCGAALHHQHLISSQSQPSIFPTEHDSSSNNSIKSAPTTMSRRRSFSYQCLNKLFNIDNEEDSTTDTQQMDHPIDNQVVETHNQNESASKKAHEEDHRLSSPRTVAGPACEQSHRSTDHQPALAVASTPTTKPPTTEEPSPYDLPQPPLEESESMSSFLHVMGAVDNLDLVDHDDDNEGNDRDAPGTSSGGTDNVSAVKMFAAPAAEEEDDTFGWYISGDEERPSKPVQHASNSFLPDPQHSDLMDAATTPTQASFTEQAPITTTTVDAATTFQEMVTTPEEEVEEEQHQEHQEEDVAALEYARAADTVDSVLGDFFG